MKIGKFDFGSEDARYLNLKTPIEKKIFTDSFLSPRGFDLSNFYDGTKCFVYGLKGSGKSALLQYIRVKAEMELNALSHFYHFHSTFSSTEIKGFQENLKKSRNKEDIIIDDSDLDGADDIAIFWRLFILVEIGKLLRRAKIETNESAAYPAFKRIITRLSRDPSVEIEMNFENAEPEDLHNYIEIAERQIEEIYLEESPIFLFIDEMEVFRSGGVNDDLHFAAVASLVRSVRDFNERFRGIDIRIIAAIRSEVIQQVSRVQGEVYRIIRDKGLSVGWEETAKDGLHPLERIILGRMVTQDSSFDGYITPLRDDDLRKALKKYFPKTNLLRRCLDLTWYRPRDFAVLFEEARLLDEYQDQFREITLLKDVIGKLGERLWQDAVSGLSVKYSPKELQGLDRVLRGGPERYNRPAFIARISDLSDQYDDVAVLSERRWSEMLEDLYRVGVVYSVAIGTGYKNFHFRGDPMPSFTSAFDVGIHQSLRGELSTIRT